MYDVIDLKSKRASQSSLKATEHSRKPDDKIPSHRGPQEGGILNELSSLEDIAADRHKQEPAKTATKPKAQAQNQLHNKIKNLSLALTERDSPVPKRKLHRTTHKTSTKNAMNQGPYSGALQSPASNYHDSHFTIKVVDGNKNISGGDVIRTHRVDKPQRNTSE